MRMFALELDIVVLPELAICSYMASQKIWKLADPEIFSD